MKIEYKKDPDGSISVERYEVTEEGTKVFPVCFGGLVDKEGLKPEAVEAAVEDKRKEVINALVGHLLAEEYIKTEVVNKVSGITGVKCTILVGTKESRDRYE